MRVLLGFQKQKQTVLFPTSKGCLEAFKYLKPTNRHPLDVAGLFCFDGFFVYKNGFCFGTIIPIIMII